MAAGQPVGTLGVIPTLTVAGRVFVDLTNLIILQGYHASNAYSTLRLVSNGSSGYQVTTGKTYLIEAVRAWSDAAAAATVNWRLGFGTTDVGLDSASAPSSPSYQIGSTAATLINTNNLPTVSSSLGAVEAKNHFQVTSQKFPFEQGTAAGSNSIMTFGYET